MESGWEMGVAPSMMLFLVPLRVVAIVVVGGDWLRDTADGVAMSISSEAEAVSIVNDTCFSEACGSRVLLSRPIEISIEETVTIGKRKGEERERESREVCGEEKNRLAEGGRAVWLKSKCRGEREHTGAFGHYAVAMRD
jgi:hypothetical protein